MTGICLTFLSYTQITIFKITQTTISILTTCKDDSDLSKSV
jgi:hypothetical protein